MYNFIFSDSFVFFVQFHYFSLGTYDTMWMLPNCILISSRLDITSQDRMADEQTATVAMKSRERYNRKAHFVLCTFFSFR